MAAVLAAGGVHLLWQAWLAAGRYSADPRNPYVYAHTGRDVYLIRDRLEALAQAHPDGHNLHIQVFSTENLWPLPWYLRSFTRVRWWNGAPDQEPPAPVILASPNMEEALTRKLYESPPPGERELYMRLFEGYIELRPQVELRGYVAKSLWDKLRRTIE
jgi:predicted membrane-bound mannosyltransferase